LLQFNPNADFVDGVPIEGPQEIHTPDLIHGPPAGGCHARRIEIVEDATSRLGQVFGDSSIPGRGSGDGTNRLGPTIVPAPPPPENYVGPDLPDFVIMCQTQVIAYTWGTIPPCIFARWVAEDKTTTDGETKEVTKGRQRDIKKNHGFSKDGPNSFYVKSTPRETGILDPPGGLVWPTERVYDFNVLYGWYLQGTDESVATLQARLTYRWERNSAGQWVNTVPPKWTDVIRWDHCK